MIAPKFNVKVKIFQMRQIPDQKKTRRSCFANTSEITEVPIGMNGLWLPRIRTELCRNEM